MYHVCVQVEQLRNNLSAVNRDKDSVSVQLSERTDRCHRLDNECRHLEETNTQLHNQNKDFCRKVRYLSPFTL